MKMHVRFTDQCAPNGLTYDLLIIDQQHRDGVLAPRGWGCHGFVIL